MPLWGWQPKRRDVYQCRANSLIITWVTMISASIHPIFSAYVIQVRTKTCTKSELRNLHLHEVTKFP